MTSTPIIATIRSLFFLHTVILSLPYIKVSSQEIPSSNPSSRPSYLPSQTPSQTPSLTPSQRPSDSPSQNPSISFQPSNKPSLTPTDKPSSLPSDVPSNYPSISWQPSGKPSQIPSTSPSRSSNPSSKPSFNPSSAPSSSSKPSSTPSNKPSLKPSSSPSDNPSSLPSSSPSLTPSATPSLSSQPSSSPSDEPSTTPSASPTASGFVTIMSKKQKDLNTKVKLCLGPKGLWANAPVILQPCVFTPYQHWIFDSYNQIHLRRDNNFCIQQNSVGTLVLGSCSRYFSGGTNYEFAIRWSPNGKVSFLASSANTSQVLTIPWNGAVTGGNVKMLAFKFKASQMFQMKNVKV